MFFGKSVSLKPFTYLKTLDTLCNKFSVAQFAPAKNFRGPICGKKRTYDWHCYRYYTPQSMEVLPTCLSLFPRDTRLLGSFSAAHDKGVLDYREGVPISPLKKRSNKVFSQGPQPISSSCPLPKVSEAGTCLIFASPVY